MSQLDNMLPQSVIELFARGVDVTQPKWARDNALATIKLLHEQASKILTPPITTKKK